MAYSNKPVLDIREPGAFDDNGMLLGDVIDVDGELRMYYVGFQLATKAKFLAFGGLATSADGGRTFVRKFKTPVIDRDDNGLFIRAIHSIRRLSDGSFRAWYSEGCSWEIISGKPFPNYNIAVVDSPDGFRFDANQGAAVAVGREGNIASAAPESLSGALTNTLCRLLLVLARVYMSRGMPPRLICLHGAGKIILG